MTQKLILKTICSLPVIFISLYFVPFIGICLITLRLFIYNNKKYYSISINLIILGIILSIPKILDLILKTIKNINIPHLEKIINSNIYINLVDYSKFIISLGIILLIISYIFKGLIEKLTNLIKTYIIVKEKQNYQISKKNDMEIKLKQERAKNTSVVHCPNCGADNILTEDIGTCKYRRRKIQPKTNNK